MVQSGGDIGGSGPPQGPPGMPRWVKLSALAAVVVAVVLILIMVVAGGEHGPGMHTGTSGIRNSHDWRG